ncbi:Hydroxyproline dehydrogenase, partial [Acropora cervicornis]
MITLPRIHRFRFIKHHIRYFQGASVVFRAIESTSVARSFPEEKRSEDNSNNARIFASKETTKILRSILVLKLCSYDFVGRNSMALMSFGQRVLGKTLFEFLLRETMYNQFVAGENLPAIQDTVKSLRQCGIGTMLCVPNEEDLSSDNSNFTERSVFYFMIFLSCLTGLKQQVNTNVWNDYVMPYKTSVETPVGRDVQTLAEGFDCKIELSFFNKNQNAHLQNALTRLDTFAKTYLQAAINHMVLALQVKYNKSYPWIYNTYQCYRKDTHDIVKANLKLMAKLGFHFGAKIVRGAYMTLERNRATEKGYKDPIHDKYEDTCTMYDDVVYTILKKASFTPAEVMVATHNEESVELVIQRMKQLGITHDSGKVSFGQLYGMCDQVSYSLGQKGYNVYKSVPFGPVEETLAYLGRRAAENRDVISRTEKERSLLWLELKRRMNSRPLP